MVIMKGNLMVRINLSAILGGLVFSTVTAFASLPDGYTQLPYIQANGSCQIQTGIVPNSTDKVELSWRPTVVSGNQGLWCSRDSSGKNAFTAFMIANKVRLDRVDTSVTCAGLLLAGTNYTVVADYATLAGVVTNDTSRHKSTLSCGKRTCRRSFVLHIAPTMALTMSLRYSIFLVSRVIIFSQSHWSTYIE